MPRTRLTVVVALTSGQTVHPRTEASIEALCSDRRLVVWTHRATADSRAVARNLALTVGRNERCWQRLVNEPCLIVDPDVVFSPDAVLQLHSQLSRRHRVVAGLCRVATDATRFDAGYFTDTPGIIDETRALQPQQGLVAVDWSEFGMVMFLGVLNRIRHPWFCERRVFYRDQDDAECCRIVSDSIALCVDFGALKYEVTCDTDVIVERTAYLSAPESSFECLVCGWEGNNLDNVDIDYAVLPNSQCPRCTAQGRHRALAYYLRHSAEGIFPSGETRRVLLMGPDYAESCLLQAFRQRIQPVFSDLSYRRVTLAQDACRLPQASASLDMVWSIHVFEHLYDETAALLEIYRVLRPGGKLMLMVPLVAQVLQTQEDWTLNGEQRAQHYLYSDHFRLYGGDLPERLAAIGFSTEVVDVSAIASPSERRRYLLDAGERLFVCTRR